MIVLALATLAVPLAASANKPVVPPAPGSGPLPLNNQLFDWNITSSPAPVNFVPAPFLSDASAAAVNAYLASLPVSTPLTVKVVAPISNSTANLIFNNPSYRVSYVFGDLEGATAVGDAARLSQQVRFINGDSKAGPTASNPAYIGNFGFQSVPNDPTQPKQYFKQSDVHSYSGYEKNDYKKAELTMINAEVYPGSPSFRNPLAGNSSAPNVRSALFTLPIIRVSNVTATAAANTPNIPWVANFNNWGNTSLHTPGSPANVDGYKYFWANPTGDQMPSRRDFATMVAHLRLRGADSLSLFESGVVGVSNDDMRADAATGWLSEASLNAIFAQPDHETFLSDKVKYPYGQFQGMSKVISDGKPVDAEDAGSILSGVFSLDLGKLDVLISNMDDKAHTISAPDAVGGYSLAVRDFSMDPGTHLLVEYSLGGSGKNRGWQVAGQHVPFTAIANSRNGFGIPEPGTLSLLAIGAVLGLNRRSRKSK